MYVMYACMLCMYVYMLCMYICMHVCYVCMHVCYICIHVCMYVYTVKIDTNANTPITNKTSQNELYHPKYTNTSLYVNHRNEVTKRILK